MKFSEAMLKGYAKVDGRQCRGRESRVIGGKRYYCALGAALGAGMDRDAAKEANFALQDAWGQSAVVLNDIDQLPWEHIYGMAVAAGL